MPQADQQNDNKFLTTLKGLSNKIKYVFNHKSVEDIYVLYVEGEFLRIIDEDFFTLLRIPEAIDTGDSINHYDYNSVNHWIAAHPKFILPFLVSSAVVGVARVIQVLSSTPTYPETVAEFLALIRQDDANEDSPEHELSDDLTLLNGLCNELGIPYYYKKGIVKKHSRKIKADKRSFLARLFIKPTAETPEVEYEQLLETREELILCKKDEPQPSATAESQNKPKPNWFERTWQKIENSKFVEYVVTPPWKAANRAVYVYWILWFSTVIVSAIMTGSLVLTATGTVTVTTAALSLVIGVPTAIFLSFWGIDLVDKFWPRKKLNDDIDFKENQNNKPNIVSNRSEQENVLSIVGKALALRIHTKQQKDKLAENHRSLIQAVPSGDIDSEGEQELISKNNSEAIHKLLIQYTPNQIINKENNQQTQENNTTFSTAKGRITWQTFFSFCTGYVISTFGVWFSTSAVTAFAIKFGALAVAGALSATVIGIPLSLLISFSVGVTVGGIFAISGAKNSSVAQKEKEAFLMEHPELRPENIAQQETALKSLQQKLKIAHEKHNALIAQHNLITQKIAANTNNAETVASNHAQQNVVQPLSIHSKLNYRTLKNTNIAYTNTNQSTFSKVCDYVLTAIGNAGRMGYITRSLMIGGMITILAVSFAHPLGFLTGPIAIATAVGIGALLFGAATVVERYYEQQRAKDELDNLRLRLFEVKEKNKLKNDLINQCRLVELHNKTLEAHVVEKQKIVDASERKVINQGNDKQNDILTVVKSWIFSENNSQPSKIATLDKSTDHIRLLPAV